MVIVAGAEMHVADQFALFAAHDQQHLRVGLETDQAVNDVCTGFLKPIRQCNIGGLIEAGHQFNDNRDLLA